MSVRNIIFHPENILHSVSESVDPKDEKTLTIIGDLADTLYSTTGVGLSAPQIGLNKRIFIYDVFRKKASQSRNYKVFINPEIVNFDGPIRHGHEGCKSLPQLFLNIPRYSQIKVRGLNQFGKNVETEASGLEAVVLQHEIDHLDGKLIFESSQLNKEQKKLYEWYAFNMNSVRSRLHQFSGYEDGVFFQEKTSLNNIFVIKDGQQIQLYFSDKDSSQLRLSGIMSRIDISNPLLLLGTYTQVMMLSLAWRSQPENIYVIGFGGGRIPLVFYHYFPDMVIESTETDQTVVDIAKKYFGIIPDERMRIFIKDGRQFLTESNKHYDFILIDTYSGSGIHPYHISTKEFYKICKFHLQTSGVVATNLVEDDLLFKEKVNTFVQSFDTVFDYSFGGVHVLFGSYDNNLSMDNFLRITKSLERKYCFSFPFFTHAKKVRVIKRSAELVTNEFSSVEVLTDLSSSNDISNVYFNVSRNDLCPCGSGKKYKKCHLLINAN